MMNLTPKQQQVYEYIKSFIARHGHSPSVREVAEHIGGTAPSTAYHHIEALEKAGWIKKEGQKKRTIRLTGNAKYSQAEPVPILHTASEVMDLSRTDNPYKHIFFDTKGEPGMHFACEIDGDSLVADGILPGDLAVVLRQKWASNGDLAAIKAGRNIRVQRVSVKKKRVLGKVVGILRKYKTQP